MYPDLNVQNLKDQNPDQNPDLDQDTVPLINPDPNPGLGPHPASDLDTGPGPVPVPVQGPIPGPDQNLEQKRRLTTVLKFLMKVIKKRLKDQSNYLLKVKMKMLDILVSSMPTTFVRNVSSTNFPDPEPM